MPAIVVPLKAGQGQEFMMFKKKGIQIKTLLDYLNYQKSMKPVKRWKKTLV